MSDLHWRYDKPGANFLHILWLCEKVQMFWQLVSLVIEEILNYPLQFCARIFLLDDLAADSFVVPAQILINNQLVAARMLIAKNWYSEWVPGKEEWS